MLESLREFDNVILYASRVGKKRVSTLRLTVAMTAGSGICRDIGDTNPVRMSGERSELQSTFRDDVGKLDSIRF